MEDDDVGFRVLLVEDADAAHVVVRGHRALGGDGNPDGIAVLDQWRQLQPDAPVQHLGSTGEGFDRLFQARPGERPTWHADHDQPCDAGLEQLPPPDRTSKNSKRFVAHDHPFSVAR